MRKFLSDKLKIKINVNIQIMFLPPACEFVTTTSLHLLLLLLRITKSQFIYPIPPPSVPESEKLNIEKTENISSYVDYNKWSFL